MKTEARPRVYDVLAKAFAQEEVRTCFALLGDANMNWAARLSEAGCRMIAPMARQGTRRTAERSSTVLK